MRFNEVVKLLTEYCECYGILHHYRDGVFSILIDDKWRELKDDRPQPCTTKNTTRVLYLF